MKYNVKYIVEFENIKHCLECPLREHAFDCCVLQRDEYNEIKNDFDSFEDQMVNCPLEINSYI